MTNYHSHCDFCDGHAPMETFIMSAIDHGLTSYGISSHSPLPDYMDYAKVLKREKVTEYLSEISRLKTKYNNVIDIYAGMEIDYIDENYNPGIEYFKNLPLDYRIGAVHFLKIAYKKYIDADTRPEKFTESLKQYYDNDLKSLILQYFDTKMLMIQTGGFDFVAHTDKISMNAGSVDPQAVNSNWYNQKIREYLEFVAEKEVMLEVNTKAYCINGMFFPNETHFELLRKLKIPLVVNSDTHRPNLINSGRMEAIERLKLAGYDTVRQLDNGVWRDVEI